MEPPPDFDFDELTADAEQEGQDEPSPSQDEPPPPPPPRKVPEVFQRPTPVAFKQATPDEYLLALNESQKKAVVHSPEGGLQILAGPGSGGGFVFREGGGREREEGELTGDLLGV